MPFSNDELGLLAYVSTLYTEQHSIPKEELNSLQTFIQMINRFDNPDITHYLGKNILHALDVEKNYTLNQMSPEEQHTWFITRTKLVNFVKSLSTSLNNSIKKIKHDNRIAQHTFVREALEDTFKGIHINSDDTEDFENNLSSIVVHAVVAQPFFRYKNGSTKNCFILKAVIEGTKFAIDNHLVRGNDLKLQKQRLPKLRKLHDKGYKFVTCIFNKNGQKCRMHPVTKYDYKQISHKILLTLNKTR